MVYKIKVSYYYMWPVLLVVNLVHIQTYYVVHQCRCFEVYIPLVMQVLVNILDLVQL